MTSDETTFLGGMTTPYVTTTHSFYDTNQTMMTADDVTQSMSTKSPYGKFGPVEQFGVFWAAIYINTYYLWVIFVIGFPGNIASFVTILRMPPLTTSTGYVAALAVVDNLSIIVKLLFHQLTLHDVHSLGPGGCKTLFFFGTFLIMYANWILVAMSVERFIAIWFPLKVTSLCTGKKSAAAMVVIAVVLGATDLHFFWTGTIVWSPDGNMNCAFHPHHNFFINFVWYWIDGALYAFIPCILLILFNTLIILGIRKSRKIQKDLTNNKSDQMAEKYRQQRQITIMLIVVSIVFVVLILPNCLFFVAKSYWITVPGSYDRALYTFVSQLVFVLSDVNHAVNFYLYFLTARRFRRRFIDSLLCRKSGRKPFTSLMRTANSNMSNTSIYTTQTSMNGFSRDAGGNSGSNNNKNYTTTAT